MPLSSFPKCINLHTEESHIYAESSQGMVEVKLNFKRLGDRAVWTGNQCLGVGHYFIDEFQRKVINNESFGSLRDRRTSYVRLTHGILPLVTASRLHDAVLVTLALRLFGLLQLPS